MGYKDDVKIDINNLDVELLRQAGLFQFWGRREADVLYKKDQIGETLSKCKARIELDIRANPTKYKYDGKPTEGAIHSLLILQPEVEEATEAFLKSKYKAKVLGIAVKSFEHKKKALEKLVDLYINGYWASPKIDPDAQKAFDAQARELADKTMKGDKRMMSLAKKREGERLADLAEQKKKDAALRAADKRSVTAQEKKAGKKTGAKTKSESKPVGKTEEQIRPKLKGAGKKKK